MNTVTCDNCGRDVPAGTQDTCPDNGWSFDPRRFGYYGGFDDNFAELLEDVAEVTMCHECVVSLIEAFPAFKKHVTRGGHPSINWNGEQPCTETKPCCNYCWGWSAEDRDDGKSTINTYVVNDAGEWELVRTHIQ